jgi:type VI secretion system protein ImpA
MKRLADPNAFSAMCDVDLDALLTPISVGGGAGMSLRSDPIYQQIRDARRQDDPTLPMGEWERPLIRADWKLVASLSSDALRTRSKDFQLAAWLCEAWTHLYRVDGFVAGTQLLIGLAERYWDVAYPLIDDGDSDARVAPFVWLNHTLALVLSLHVPLIVIEERDPPEVSLDEFQRTVGSSGAQDNSAQTRELIDKHAMKSGNLASLAFLQERLGVAGDAWQTLSLLVDLQLDADAPSLAAVGDALARLSRAATSLIGEHSVPVAQNAGDELADASVHEGRLDPDVAMRKSGSAGSFDDAQRHSLLSSESSETSLTTAGRLPMTEIAAGGAVTSLTGLIADRAHAYRLLGELATYLARHEPHSPTPYLLKRAVSWGQMPLPDLMREIMQQEGDLTRYLALLGLA